LLINAVAELKDDMKGYQVLIAGEGDAGYIAELKNLTKQKGVNGIVRFIGGIYGDTKWELYRNADILVLPTHSENFGIVVAEALASGTPVITTTGTPWDELNTKPCGWWIPCNKIDLKQTIISAISLTGEKLEQYGRNGRLLIEERYSADTVAQKMKLLYDRIFTNQIY
jgi:glycosyltransferase involved in cell wall biosynthesis